MLLKYVKTLLMSVILLGFASSSFAVWVAAPRTHTVCHKGVCHHTKVHRGCVNGHCGAVKHGTVWRR